MLLAINQIKVAERIRKEFGNIEELANDIKENGIINPPVVTPEHELIAGERRLRACKYLNYQQIEVRVMSVRDYEHKLKIEIGENEHRKEFTFSERMAWARELERVESAKARERMSEGGKGRQNSVNLRTDDKVSNDVGLGSRDTYRKAKFIAEHADSFTITKLDNEETSIHKAYTELKAKLKEKEKLLHQETEKRKRAEQETFSARKSEELTRKQLEEFEQQEPQIIEKKVVKEVEIESQEHISDIKRLNDDNKKLKEKIRFYQEQAESLQEENEELKQDAGYLPDWNVNTFCYELEEIVKACSFSSKQVDAILAAPPNVKAHIHRNMTTIQKLMKELENTLDRDIINV
ncbi:ParB N-terminal domain-containing protein [Bacillus thuringiensis]|uniref:ParB N-terminal domain-containing protein n=1 Tax=Bacillus thuringiensis TaxID=1428 RepID=UPI0034579925